jgi:uncharacterized protein (PEP-CTERM system associated)
MYHVSKNEIILSSYIGFCLVIFPASAISGQWRLSPAVTLTQSYTDNLELANRSPKQDYITELNPKLNLTGKGARVNADIDYTMQNLYYIKNQEYNRTEHQLSAAGGAELIRNNFFVDANAGIEQAIVAADQARPIDNVNVGNRTNVKRFGVSPYIQSELQGNATTEIRYTRSAIEIDEGASNSRTDRYNVDIASGPKYYKFVWSIAYDKTKEKRDSGEIINFENASANARYRLFDSFHFLAEFGYANNDFQSLDTINNGTYRAFGLGFQPNDKLLVDALYSNQYNSVSTVISPTPRTSLKVIWRDSKVGLNAGQVWRGDFNLNIKRTNWIMSYQEDTTTTQQLQQGTTGSNSVVNPDFGLTDDVFERKLGRVSFKYSRAKSQWALSYFSEQRVSKRTGEKQKVHGSSASLTWRTGAKTNILISGSTEKRLFENDGASDNTRFAAISLNRIIKRKHSASIGFHSIDQESIVESRSYKEIRVYASINLVLTSQKSIN